ncbi:MAG: CAP domain-containing protein [Chloroflexota bacterium]
MIRKAFVLMVSTAMLLSACGAKATEETTPPATATTTAPTETAVPPSTEALVSIETPAASPTVTLTATVFVPTNPPDCTNNASFVADVTVPDNSSVSATSIFTKTWAVRNTGTCVWGPDYTVTHYSEERLGAPISLPLSVTYPGQTVDISMTLSAPSTLGPHRANFVIKNPGGLIMKIDNDSRLWVIINVTAALAADTPGIPGTGSGSGSPTPGTASGTGFAEATCAYTLDASKVTEVINAINAHRAKNGAEAYTVNDKLTQAAQAHANDIACNQLFVHTGSDGSTPQTRVAASGYIASSVSENVYGSYPPATSQGVVNWWITDRTDVRHGQNLISTKFTEIGVAYSFYNNFGYYVVVFAAP